MSYKITDECISCGACEPECSNQAISEGDTTYKIDHNKCTECVGAHASSKCAEVCPVEACVADPAHKESREQMLAKWKGLHPGETRAST